MESTEMTPKEVYEAALARIVKDPQFLTKKSRPVETAEDQVEAQRVADDLLQAAQALNYGRMGVAGLAANQLGELIRVFIIRRGAGFQVFINPEILDTKEPIMSTETCFSRPNDTFGKRVKRFKRIKVKGSNTNVIKLRKMEAIAFQHELDHLNGVFI